MNFLKSFVPSSSPYQIIEPLFVHSSSSLQYKVMKVKYNGSIATLFEFQKETSPQVVDYFIKKLRSTRHPSVLSYITHITNSDGKVVVITEECVSLSTVLNTFNEQPDMLTWGIYLIAKGLIFFQEANLYINELSFDSIYVTPSYDWKIFHLHQLSNEKITSNDKLFKNLLKTLNAQQLTLQQYVEQSNIFIQITEYSQEATRVLLILYDKCDLLQSNHSEVEKLIESSTQSIRIGTTLGLRSSYASLTNTYLNETLLPYLFRNLKGNSKLRDATIRLFATIGKSLNDLKIVELFSKLDMLLEDEDKQVRINVIICISKLIQCVDVDIRAKIILKTLNKAVNENVVESKLASLDLLKNNLSILHPKDVTLLVSPVLLRASIDENDRVRQLAVNLLPDVVELITKYSTSLHTTPVTPTSPTPSLTIKKTEIPGIEKVYQLVVVEHNKISTKTKERNQQTNATQSPPSPTTTHTKTSTPIKHSKGIVIQAKQQSTNTFDWDEEDSKQTKEKTTTTINQEKTKKTPKPISQPITQNEKQLKKGQQEETKQHKLQINSKSTQKRNVKDSKSLFNEDDDWDSSWSSSASKQTKGKSLFDDWD
ncbi:Protein kinase domain-containing protein [Entamoeba marina]